MVVIGHAMPRQHVADQSPKPALHTIAHHSIADSLGHGNAKAKPGSVIALGEQDETGSGNSETAISSQKIGAFGQHPKRKAALRIRLAFSPGQSNAQAESFMKTLKVEDVYPASYETFAEVAERLPTFIEDVYNALRLHSALG